VEHRKKGEISQGYDPLAPWSDTHDLQRPRHQEARFSRAGSARSNEPDTGRCEIEICRFDLPLSSSSRFAADQLGLVAAYLRGNRLVSGIAEVYQNIAELCDDLDRNFLEFKAFAEGDPGFFTGLPGPRFRSFAEFVEETELHLQSATLSLRLEDCMVDPGRKFSKIIELMSVDLDLSRSCTAYPKSKPYRYLALRQQVSPFRSFIDVVDAETRSRIEKMGYAL
jgi:hypothetical protein